MNASLRAALQREVAMRDDIMSLIGHDLRTPFNSLLSGADVVRIYLEQDKPQAALDYLQTMRNAAAWAHNLLEDLLAWGHAQARAGTGTEARERVADVIADALGPNRPAMADKGITPDVDDGGLGVRVAPQAGRAMLRNLISNAVKHADPNTTVSIQAVPRAAGVEIAVQDDGPGLPDGLQRALASDRPPDEIRDAIRRTSGGLGLYLAAKIAETAGGRLLARTPAQGRGAVLAVWLPDA
jgi:signal transduction histidine kinase